MTVYRPAPKQKVGDAGDGNWREEEKRESLDLELAWKLAFSFGIGNGNNVQCTVQES